MLRLMSSNVKNIITIVLLLFIPLIGIILMWFWTTWHKAVKIAVTLILIIPAFATLAYLFIGQTHVFSGNSMEPTMHSGQYFFGSKLTKSDLKRGDIVVHKNPLNLDQDFAKRIIGLPAEEITISKGKVYINGNELSEPYLAPGTMTYADDFLTEGKSIKIPENNYFVMGDNREHSSDSRNFGFVDRKLIVDKYWFTYYNPK